MRISDWSSDVCSSDLVAGASILITRGKDGAVRAFHNVCTHRGTRLVAESSGNRSAFTCRYHAWTFNNDGQLRSAPDRSEEHTSELQSLMRISYAVFCLKKTHKHTKTQYKDTTLKKQQ